MNGEVVRTFAFGDSRTSLDVSGSILVEHSGWLLLRAWNEDANPLIFDQYPYATTTPVYVSVGDEVPRSAADADYFIAWISRIREAVQSHSDYNSDSERDSIRANLSAAEREFEACRVE